MLPMMSSAIGPLFVGQIRFARLIHQHLRKEVPAVSESNMNCRFSSSSADWRIGRLVCEKCRAIPGPTAPACRIPPENHRPARLARSGVFKVESAGGSAGRRSAVRVSSSSGAVCPAVPLPAVDFFEHGILLEFLLDQRLEFQRRCLKQRQRLLHLRCEHQRLRQALR